MPVNSRTAASSPILCLAIVLFAGALFLFVLAVTSPAQTVKPAVKPAVPAAAAPAPATPAANAEVKPALPPALTEVEQLKLENLQLKYTALQTQQQALQKAYGDLVQQIQAEHPGFALTPNNTLVPVPKPPAPPAKK